MVVPGARPGGGPGGLENWDGGDLKGHLQIFELYFYFLIHILIHSEVELPQI